MKKLSFVILITCSLAGSGLAMHGRLTAGTDQILSIGASYVNAVTVRRHWAQVELMKASPALAETPAEKYRARWLSALHYLNDVPIVMNDIPRVFSADELIFNIRRLPRNQVLPQPLPWSLLSAAAYDQIPRSILEVILIRQVENLGQLEQERRLEEISIEEWKNLPPTIQKMAVFDMVWYWVGRRDPERYDLAQAEAARILIAVGIVESFFDMDKTSNKNEKTGNEDRGYFQISDMVRRDLSYVAEFRDYKASDYYHPWVSTQAASYHFFERLMKQTGGDVLRAVGMYNAGPHGNPKRAEQYLLVVADRYFDSFIQKDRHSPTRFLLLQHAVPAYFEGIKSDRLFDFLVQELIVPGP